MQYSNGWGHMIVTLAVIAATVLMIIFHDLDIGTGVAIMSPVISFWFLSGAVNRFNGSPNPTVAHTIDASAPGAPEPKG